VDVGDEPGLAPRVIDGEHALLKSILIANRGEIAVRIIRACREMGIRSIAVYSDADEDALHTRLADEAHRLGPAPVRESYLSVPRLLDVAKRTRAQAVHPGYGLLSENADFATAVIAAGLVFIGPPPAVIATMGDKLAARAAARRCDVPLLPGSEGTITDAADALRVSKVIGFPLLVKACFGGGGRGMRVVQDSDGLDDALRDAGRESKAAFGRAEVYLERFVASARHVEVQVLGDAHGTLLHLGDRDCSVQRRHQKLIEEAPAPELSYSLRAALAEAAIRLSVGVGYQSVGTVEFLVDAKTGGFYFLEMNTRLQVEHGVTELVSGVDLVQAQIRVAAGEPLGFSQGDVRINGHAIQGRIAAEDPWDTFRPRTGKIDSMSLPLGPWLRLDFGVEAGDVISAHYDSMFGKLQAWGTNRESARRRLAVGLGLLKINGILTTAPYLRQVLEQPDFIASTHDTGSVERNWSPDPAFRPEFATQSDTASQFSRHSLDSSERRVRLGTSRGLIEVSVYGRRHRRPEVAAADGSRASGANTSSLNTGAEPVALIDGLVSRIAVAVGERVEKGAALVILEAMKMELPVLAPRTGVVEAVMVLVGDVVTRGTLLVKLSAAESILKTGI
jgi:acetyl-CoA/propionyl-CoA carboxylase, biotin carboxylase, biotin carboxyl carrier protein